MDSAGRLGKILIGMNRALGDSESNRTPFFFLVPIVEGYKLIEFGVIVQSL